MEVAVDALLWWKARYGFNKKFTIKTDNGSHFAGHLLKELSQVLRYKHNFSIVYSPWSNGSAEVSNRTIINIIKSLVSEYSLSNQDWKYLLPVIQSIMNNRKRKSTGLSPNDIFFGVNERGENILVSEKFEKWPIVLNGKLMMPKNENKLKTLVYKLGDEVQKIWKKVYNIKEMIRRNARLQYNKRFNTFMIQYQVGDFVLVSIKDHLKNRKKTKLHWIGPYQVILASGPYLYELMDCERKVISVHSCRMKFYEKADFEVTEVVKTVFLHNKGEFLLEKIDDIKYKNGRYWLLCLWHGLTEMESTWELMEEMLETNKEMVLNFLDKKKSDPVVKTVLLHLTKSDVKKAVGNRLL